MESITAPCAFRFREKASVFLTELHPAPGPEQRAELLARLRRRDHDASHHCSAWRQGPGPEGAIAQGADDDGEPSGTAGAPMLRVLEGADLVNLIAVCIRWFGGTKLGTGGLVRAYTDGVQGALAEARTQGLLRPVRLWRQGRLAASAERAHLCFAVLGAVPGAEVLGQAFGPEGMEVRFRLPPEAAGALETAWRERSRGGTVAWDP